MMRQEVSRHILMRVVLPLLGFSQNISVSDFRRAYDQARYRRIKNFRIFFVQI